MNPLVTQANKNNKKNFCSRKYFVHIFYPPIAADAQFCPQLGKKLHLRTSLYLASMQTLTHANLRNRDLSTATLFGDYIVKYFSR